MASFKFAIGRPFTTGLSEAQSGNFLSPASVTTFTSSGSRLALATGYSVTDGNHEHINRTVRWTIEDNKNAVYSFNLQNGASAPIGVFIENVNTKSIGLRRGDTTGTALGATDLGNFTVSQNTLTGRYSAFIETVGTGSTNVQVVLRGYSTGGGAYDYRVNTSDAYLELGRVSVIHATTPTTALTQNFSTPYSITVSRSGSQRYLPGGMTESTDLSPQYSLIDLTGEFDRTYPSDNTTTLLHRLMRMQPTERCLFFENRGDTSRAFMTHLNTDVEITEDRWPLLTCNLGLREVL